MTEYFKDLKQLMPQDERYKSSKHQTYNPCKTLNVFRKKITEFTFFFMNFYTISKRVPWDVIIYL
jgi:hypothetical protein